MAQRHQKGSLSSKHEAKRGRGASPMASLPERGPNERETLAASINTIVRQRGLTVPEAAKIAGEPVQRMSLLLGGKLFSFTTQKLTRILAKLRAETL